METVIAINNSIDPGSRYIGWTPMASAIRLIDPGPIAGPVAVTLRNQNPAVGGQVLFSPGTTPLGGQITLNLPVNGASVFFWLAGLFGRPSVADGDASIEVRAADGTVLSVTRLMVRVRKNANLLTSGERTRVVSALATLNSAGTGAFTRFRDMHRELTSAEAHGLPGFLPWHRAYLLDFERELQRIDPSVSLPYWRFDQPAPNLFSPDFLGVSDTSGIVRFSSSNPIQFWRTDGQSGISRWPFFNTATQIPNVIDENATLRLGGPGALYSGFDDMEATPHGRAHTSFGGFVGSIDTAARDPLFFLLHANVDRLWAKWQWFFRRFNTTSTATYPFLGVAGNAGSARIGHNLFDTMWPWNRDTVPPRPTTAPGGAFPAAAFAAAPGPTPRVGDVIDYRGVTSPLNRLGFDYDDVPFEL
jgi:tyrosinase